MTKTKTKRIGWTGTETGTTNYVGTQHERGRGEADEDGERLAPKSVAL